MPQKYARAAGVLFVISMIAGFFGEMYAPSKINAQFQEPLFRWGFAAYLVEALCDIILTWIFYVLLRPVHRQLSLLAAFFGIVSTSTFASAQLFYFASQLLFRDAAYLAAFTTDQRHALALLAMKTCTLGGGVFMVFYGAGMTIRGTLIFHSTYLPKLLGVLLALAGLGFFTRAFLLVLAPRYASGLLLAPMALAGLALALWLLTKGVDETRWPDA